MADVEFNFEENRVEIKRAISDAIGAVLLEASAVIVSQAARNTPVDTGQLKGSWKANVNEAKGIATIGSELENAIWNEFGTGQYALHGDGRKTPWKYEDVKGKWHTTTGKRPQRSLWKAIESRKSTIIQHFIDEFGAKFK